MCLSRKPRLSAKAKPASRVRQASESAGSGESDPSPVTRFMTNETGGLIPLLIRRLSYINDHRNDTSSGGRRCRILLPGQRGEAGTNGGNVSIPNRQTRSEQRRFPEETFLQKRTTLAHRVRRPHQRPETPAWAESMSVSGQEGTGAGLDWASCPTSPQINLGLHLAT